MELGLNAAWHPGSDPRTEKGHLWGGGNKNQRNKQKALGNLSKVCHLVTVSQHLSFDKWAQ